MGRQAQKRASRPRAPEGSHPPPRQQPYSADVTKRRYKAPALAGLEECSSSRHRFRFAWSVLRDAALRATLRTRRRVARDPARCKMRSRAEMLLDIIKASMDAERSSSGAENLVNDVASGPRRKLEPPPHPRIAAFRLSLRKSSKSNGSGSPLRSPSTSAA
jgi:hypothetical protein